MAKLKTIVGAIALGEFTIQQLHKRTGVPTSTLHTVIDRNPALFVEIGKDRTHRPGGQPSMYRVQLEAATAYVHEQTHPATVIGAALQAEYQNLLWRIRKADDATANKIIERARKFVDHLGQTGDAGDEDIDGAHRAVILALIEFARLEVARDPSTIKDALKAHDALHRQAVSMAEIGQAKLADAIHKRILESKLHAWLNEAAERGAEVMRGAARRSAEHPVVGSQYTVPDKNAKTVRDIWDDISQPPPASVP